MKLYSIQRHKTESETGPCVGVPELREILIAEGDHAAFRLKIGPYDALVETWESRGWVFLTRLPQQDRRLYPDFSTLSGSVFDAERAELLDIAMRTELGVELDSIEDKRINWVRE